MKHFWNIAAAAAMAILAVGAGTVTAAAKETTETVPAAAAEEKAEAAVTPGWFEENGKRYYRFEDGSLAVGEQVIDGVAYLFAASGAQKMDWQTVNGKRWYFDPATGEPAFGWSEYFGKSYYIDPEQGKLTGVQEVTAMTEAVEGDMPLGNPAPPAAEEEEEHYCFNDEGSLQTGFFVYENTSYYADPESGKCEPGMHSYEGTVFFTDETGARLNGWQEQDGKRYYISEETGSAVYGLFEVDGVHYFGTPDGLHKGEYWFEDECCLFDEITGELHEGWYLKDGALHYFDFASLKNLRSEFSVIDGDTYYFDADGVAVTGLQVIDGLTYYFDEEAIMQHGFQEVDGKRYLLDEETGAACSGVYQTEAGTYRFGEDGSQQFGWVETEDGSYYTDEETGLVLPGWQTVGNKDYKFDEEGLMISDGRLYNQFDPKWKEVQFNSSSSSTMYASACGIFSFCNAIFALNRSEPDAVEVAKWAIGVGAYQPGVSGTTSAIFYRYVEDEYGEQFHFHVDGRYDGVTIRDDRLINHLLNGGVAIVNVPGHFMACTGYDPETGLYHILESACSSSRGLEGDSWVSAEKLSSGGTQVGLFVLLSNREALPEIELGV